MKAIAVVFAYFCFGYLLKLLLKRYLFIRWMKTQFHSSSINDLRDFYLKPIINSTYSQEEINKTYESRKLQFYNHCTSVFKTWLDSTEFFSILVFFSLIFPFIVGPIFICIVIHDLFFVNVCMKFVSFVKKYDIEKTYKMAQTIYDKKIIESRHK